MYGLPTEVVFCKRCVMSNQRPSTSPEFKKKDAAIKGAAFGDDGVCDTCKYFDYKKTIDWAAREAELKELCDRFRRTDGRYDVIVPGSGGKDSIFVSHLLKEKYGMHPLTVTWAPHVYTDVGWRNFSNWLRAGFDNTLVTPNPKVHALLTRLAFLNLVNPFQPFIVGQKNVAPRGCLQYDVELVMYGENQAEAHNTYGETLSPLMDLKHFTTEDEDENLYFGGVEMGEIIEQYGIPKAEFNLYRPILREKVEKAKVEVHYMSYYVNWSPQDNYFYALEHADFESNPDGRSEGTYSKYASLDDRVDGQHYFTMYTKFGQGRATNDACRDIRDGYITREEGVSLVQKYDHEFPKKYFGEFLQYVGITEAEYWEVIDKARPPHLWERRGNEWRIKHQVE